MAGWLGLAVSVVGWAGLLGLAVSGWRAGRVVDAALAQVRDDGFPYRPKRWRRAGTARGR